MESKEVPAFISLTKDEDNLIKPKKRKNPFKESKEDKERRQKKRSRLIVRNISFKSTEETLRKHFEQWGKLEEVNLLKRADGKLVGCAFLQYETVNQATKAILKANNQQFLGRALFVDWAIGKDKYTEQQKIQKVEPEEKKPKLELENEIDEIVPKSEDENQDKESAADSANESEESDEDESDNDEKNDDHDDDDDNDDDEDEKSKKGVEQVKKVKHLSNDVQEGCTIFLKNVPFDADEKDLRKICRKYGLLWYAIINRDQISGHSKGTAFVKFKTKESADLCLQAGAELILMDQVLEPHPALSKEELQQQSGDKSKQDSGKDSRNLYLAREGLIMAGSKAADGVSASDMAKRHQLEQVKTQVLKNLNRFVSRNRLSIHNLPLNYDDEKLKQMAIAHTGLRPHECRVMREHKITPEHPKGRSKGFGFLSFSTHRDALTALRKLNNNPKIFGNVHRPIVAFSIEDRAVHKIKEKRLERSKLKNPTYQEKLEKRKIQRKEKNNKPKMPKPFSNVPQNDDKAKLKKHIKELETARAAKGKPMQPKKTAEVEEEYVGTAAKPGTSMRMRSNKKIYEQAKEHKKKVKANKRKEKQQKIKQIHLAERQADVRPKQGRKVERDDLKHLVNKYKRMIDSKANENGPTTAKVKKPKRTKWYTE